MSETETETEHDHVDESTTIRYGIAGTSSPKSSQGSFGFSCPNGVWLQEIPIKTILRRELPNRKGVYVCLTPAGCGKTTRAKEVYEQGDVGFSKTVYLKFIDDVDNIQKEVKRLLKKETDDRPLVEILNDTRGEYVLMLDQCEVLKDLDKLKSFTQIIAVGSYANESSFRVVMFFSEIKPAVKALTANGGTKVRPLLSGSVLYSDRGIKWTNAQCAAIVVSIMLGSSRGEAFPDSIFDHLLESCCMSGCVDFCRTRTQDICQIYSRCQNNEADEVEIQDFLNNTRIDAIVISQTWKKFSLFHLVSMYIRMNPSHEDGYLQWCEDLQDLDIDSLHSRLMKW